MGCILGQPPVPTMLGVTFSNAGVIGRMKMRQTCSCLEYEFLAYSNPEFGSDKRLLDFSDVANTFLHSYGNALMSCPCNCRQSGFSRQSLERKGLRGCFVQSRVHHNPRYLHPRELGLLLGLPNSVQYPFRPREHLALL